MKVLVAIYPFLSEPVASNEIDFVINPWGRSASSDEIEDELIQGQYDGLIVGTREIKKSIAEQNPSLKVISRVGVGYNNIDVEYFKQHGVVTTYTPFGPTDSTAEMAVALILGGSRRLISYDNMIKKGEWERDFSIRMMDATLGIVGFGRIGKKVATLLKAFGCRILLHDIKPDLATAHAMGWEFVDKGEILKNADIITLHVPLKEDTRNWLSCQELNILNRPVTIVNTARGGIINEHAMYEYLRDHPESYYCCDVFEEEPYTGKLAELNNTLLTPHASSFTYGSRRQTEILAIENCLQILTGKPCSNIVQENE